MSNYILITSARNEEKYIEFTIKSVLNQTILPSRWIIISDCSTDQTDAIVQSYSQKFPFIYFQRNSEWKPNMTVTERKVNNIKSAVALLDKFEFDYIGNLDADVSFESNYYEMVLTEFNKNPKLGLCGGFIYNVLNGKLLPMFTNPEGVGGPIQSFRKECWDDIGGYLPLAHEDTLAIVCAQMKGWEVRSLKELIVKHHKAAGLPGRKYSKALLHLGKTEYLVGDHWLYQAIRSIAQISEKPIILSTIYKLVGFWTAKLSGVKIQTPEEIMIFMRNKQLEKLKLGFLSRK